MTRIVYRIEAGVPKSIDTSGHVCFEKTLGILFPPPIDTSVFGLPKDYIFKVVDYEHVLDDVEGDTFIIVLRHEDETFYDLCDGDEDNKELLRYFFEELLNLNWKQVRG